MKTIILTKNELEILPKEVQEKISSINNIIHKSPDFNSRVQYDEFVFLLQLI